MAEVTAKPADRAAQRRAPARSAAAAKVSLPPQLLSSPGEAAERRADARAARPAGGGTTRPAGAATRPAFLPAGTPSPIAERAPHGRSLHSAEAELFQARYAMDLGHVRLHTDDSAANLAAAADARAFTVGSHIFFDRGEYQPSTTRGRELLGHELAHVAEGDTATPRLFRQPHGVTTAGEPETTVDNDDTAPETWKRLEVQARGMDEAAGKLAEQGSEDGRNYVYIGLDPKFVKVYNTQGKALGGKVPMKDDAKITFNPGVYFVAPNGDLIAMQYSSKDDRNQRFEPTGPGGSVIGKRPLTDDERKQVADEQAAAKKENRDPRPVPVGRVNFRSSLSDPAQVESMVAMVADPVLVYFVPTYFGGAGGKGGGEVPTVYASPIEGRGDGKPANAPPWPVTLEGPKLISNDSDPTFSAKVDWTANGNYSLASQVISQVGTSIHYRWETFDITQYAKKEIAKDPAGTKTDPAAQPEKTLDQRIEEFKTSKQGTGTDVTGMGGANREFARAYEDWLKDTKRAAKGGANPDGDTVAERMSNRAANELSLELAPVSFLITTLGAVASWVADLFAGERQQQEVPFKKNGIFLIRVITTPAISEDTKGNQVIRPPSVAGHVVEVTPMETAVTESLGEPAAQLAELQAQIDQAQAAGNESKAEYLRDLLAQAKQRFEGLPVDVLQKQRDTKQAELDKYAHDYPSLSTYSRQHEIDVLDDRIRLAKRHEDERRDGATDDEAKNLPPMVRVNATLISEVSGTQYPLLMSAGPMVKDGDNYRWLISDVTNKDGADPYIGSGPTPSAAFRSALVKFGNKAAYGRGKIGVRTDGLGLEDKADRDMMVDSAPADWALAQKRIDDLVTTLAALGLVIASAGTAGAIIGAAAAAARLIQRWQAGKLSLDGATISDALGVLGGVGAVGQVVSGLRVAKFGEAFGLLQEGQATEAQLAKASELLTGAQSLNHAVELANEAIGYAGLLWGDLSFIDQMIEINDQETSGSMTHAEARRQRASAISSAIQNHALFIAGNVLKAKAKAKAAGETTPPAPHDDGPQTHETDPTTPKDDAAKDNAAKDDAAQDKAAKDKAAKDKEPAVAEPKALPIGERPATVAELREALPADLRDLLVYDTDYHGDGARAEWTPDADGLVSDITLRVGPETTPSTIRAHVDTIRTMQKYQGFSGRMRQALAWIADLVGSSALKPELDPSNKPLFDTQLEIKKLTKIVADHLNAMQSMEPNAQTDAEAKLDNLRSQLEEHLGKLDIGEVTPSDGVSARGIPKKNLKKYNDLLKRLRALDPQNPSERPDHKKIRWEMYELTNGTLPEETWGKIYDANIEKASKASASVTAEQARLGYGKTEQVVPGTNRRLDIADIGAKKGAEVKAYSGGTVYASDEVLDEVKRDAKLVRLDKWDITWIFIDCVPSGPLEKSLLAANIKIDLRVRSGTTTIPKGTAAPMALAP